MSTARRWINFFVDNTELLTLESLAEKAWTEFETKLCRELTDAEIQQFVQSWLTQFLRERPAVLGRVIGASVFAPDARALEVSGLMHRMAESANQVRDDALAEYILGVGDEPPV